jgi:hypothetical protein
MFLHNLLNVLLQIANKMGFKKITIGRFFRGLGFHGNLMRCVYEMVVAGHLSA